MKSIKLAITLLFLVSIFGIIGCNKTVDDIVTGTKESGSLSLEVSEIIWGDTGFVKEEKKTVEVTEVGELISDTSYGTIKVTEVTQEEIIFEFEGSFVVKGDSGINLSAEPLTEFELVRGQTVKFASQTMDAGVTVTVTFN